MKIRIGISTCPNDTFMFDALIHKRINTSGFEFELYMGDILHLNQLAIKGELDMVKLSYNTFGSVLDKYVLLEAGSALGRSCGPLLISRPEIGLDWLLNNGVVAIPGERTTANLLLSYFAPKLKGRKEMLFHEVMPSVKQKMVEGGVIIHENRFTYQHYGLVCLQDLGAYWEANTGLPIPLGAICVKKGLGKEVIHELNRMMHESVAYAFARPSDSGSFVKAHAQEMEEAVMKAHINLYVNEFSLQLGDEGKEAIQKLLETGIEMGLYPLQNVKRIRERSWLEEMPVV